jgi:hypothetical protein
MQSALVNIILQFNKNSYSLLQKSNCIVFADIYN